MLKFVTRRTRHPTKHLPTNLRRIKRSHTLLWLINTLFGSEVLNYHLLLLKRRRDVLVASNIVHLLAPIRILLRFLPSAIINHHPSNRIQQRAVTTALPSFITKLIWINICLCATRSRYLRQLCLHPLLPNMFYLKILAHNQLHRPLQHHHLPPPY